ncbi:MAG: glutaredoxin [Erysipelotrichaceae bacterium]|nr:glutaredoxin [Erysipelotrichaceae bacterium]MBR3005528.1 glutaredoxin [Erysipelotrichaceae bacterium]MBR6232447.1 glutaredoxin [Erysipelotrichaceae bacterium]
MIKVYGSLKCPYCVVLKENLDRNKIEYDFIDILASLSNLGAFLSLRDKDPVFDRLKEIEDIGVPALIDESGKVWIDWETWLKENGYEIFVPESTLTAPSCSLDRKGC